MEWIYGFSDWCRLGQSCTVNWHAWSALGTLLAAGATLLAIRTALRTSQDALRDARAAREGAAIDRARSNEDRCRALALAFDHEIYLLGGLLSHVLESFTTAAIREDPFSTIRWVNNSLPQNPLPLLTRFAGELPLFGQADSAKLFAALGGWSSLREALTIRDTEQASPDELAAWLEACVGMLSFYRDELRRAREVSARWAGPLHHAVTPDW